MSFSDINAVGFSRLNASSRIAESQKAARAPKETSVYIFTDPDEKQHLAFANSLIDRSASDGVAAEMAASRGVHLTGKIRALREEGKIGDGTQVIILFHRALESGHVIDTPGARTADILKALREPLEPDGAPCAATIYVASCKAGDERLRNDVQSLHNKWGVGSCFLLSGKKKTLALPVTEMLCAMCEEVAHAQRCGESSFGERRLFPERPRRRIGRGHARRDLPCDGRARAGESRELTDMVKMPS